LAISKTMAVSTLLVQYASILQFLMGVNHQITVYQTKNDDKALPTRCTVVRLAKEELIIIGEKIAKDGEFLCCRS